MMQFLFTGWFDLHKLIRLFLPAALFFCVCSAVEPYWLKPDWWDEIASRAVLHEEGSLNDIYSKTRDETLKQLQIPLRDWLIMGPFPAPDRLDTPHPLDQAPEFVQTARYPDASGAMIPWANLEAKKEAVPEAFKDGNFIAYLANVFEIRQPRPVWLVVAHDDGMKLWINEEPVYSRGRNQWTRIDQRIELDLKKAGRNHLFAKLNQINGNWGIDVDVYPVDPIRVDTFALAYALTRPSTQDDKSWLGLSQRLVQRFVDLGEMQNYMHWQRLRYPKMNAKDQAELLKWVAARAEEEADILPMADEFFEEVLTRKKDIDLIATHLDFLEGAQDPVRLRRRLTSYLPTLRAETDFQADFRMLRLHLLEGDLKACRELIRRLKRSYSELEGNKEFAALEEQVEEMRRRIAQVNVDWDFDATVRQAARLAETDPNELNRFLRQVLRDKAGALIKAEEANLYIGSGRKYLEAFSIYAPSYEQDLADYLNLLVNQLGLSAAEKQIRLQELSLQSIDVPADEQRGTPPSVRSYRLPSTPAVQPLLTMKISSRELLMESPDIRGPVTRTPPASIASQENITVLQNSRSLAVVKDQDVLWHQVWDTSHLEVSDEVTPWHRTLTPALHGDQVFARILNQGVYQVVAADVETGNLQWVWKENGRVVCTNPVVWKNAVIFVVRTTGQVSQYHLVFVDRHTGKTERELTLLSASHERWYHPAGTRVEFDHYMSDPVISGNKLYLQTNNGIVTSVDLPRKRFDWLRTYPLKAGFGKDSVGRKITKPVITGGVAVFSPFDGRVLMSIDARTGQLITQMGSFDWKDIRPYGSRALILDEHGVAQVVDPETLEVVETLDGDGYRYISELEGGAVLQKGQTLEVWSDQQGLRSRETVPDSFTAIAATPHGTFFYRPEHITPTVYSSLATPSPVPVRLPVVQSPSRQAVWRRAENGLYLISADSVQKWGTGDEPHWTVPHAHTGNPGQIQVYEAGKWVYLVTGNTVELLDAASGNVLERYPRPGEDRHPVEVPELFGDTLVFSNLTGRDNRRHDTRRVIMTGTDLSFSPVIDRRTGFITAFRNEGNDVIVQTRDQLQIFQVDDETNQWEKQSSTKLPKSRRTSFRGIGGQHSVWIRDDAIGLIDPQGVFTDFKLNYKEGRHRSYRDGYHDLRWIEPLLIFRNHAHYWDVVDLDRQRDLGQPLNSATRPIVHEGLVHGFTLTRNSLTHRTVDIQTGSVTEGEKISFKGLNWATRFTDHEVVSFLVQDRIYVLLEVRGKGETHEEFPMAVLDIRSGTFEQKSFPDPGDVRSVEVWNDHLWLSMEEGHLRLPVSTVESLAEKSPVLRESVLPPPEDLRIDGVLPEWTSDTFLNAGKSQVSATMRNGPLVIAGVIRNPAFIHELGRSGIDERVTLHLFHGPDASFHSNKGARLSPGVPGNGLEFKYFVTPTGDELTFELSLTKERLEELKLDFKNRKEGYAFRGDLALDFSIETGAGSRLYAFAERPWPVWFPRFMLFP